MILGLDTVLILHAGANMTHAYACTLTDRQNDHTDLVRQARCLPKMMLRMSVGHSLSYPLFLAYHSFSLVFAFCVMVSKL